MIDETRKEQAKAPGLQEPAKKALATLDRQWDGLIAHRDYPMAGLDNNLAERTIRGPVVTRKNAGRFRQPRAPPGPPPISGPSSRLPSWPG